MCIHILINLPLLFFFSELRKNEQVAKILSEVGPEGLPDDSLGYHPRCYAYFTNKSSLDVMKRKIEEPQKSNKSPPKVKRLSSRRRDRLGETCFQIEVHAGDSVEELSTKMHCSPSGYFAN